MVTEATGPVKHAVVSESTSASNAIIAAVSGKKIRVLAACLSAAGTVTATLEDEDDNDLCGPLSMTAADALVLPFNPSGWFETPATKALHLLLGGAVAVGGSITYQEVG